VKNRPLVVAALVGVLALAGCTPQAPAPTLTPAPTPTVASIGGALAGEGWTVTVNSVQLDSDTEVIGTNEFNPAPGDGKRYALVNLTLERTRTPAAAPLDVDVAIDVDGEQYREAAAQAPAQLRVLSPVDSGATVTGNLAYLLPADAKSIAVVVTIADSPVPYLVAIE